MMLKMLNDVERDRETYLTYAKLDCHKRRIDEARQIIREALKTSERPMVSFSGGKDSIVLLDLLFREGARCNVIFFSYGYSRPNIYYSPCNENLLAPYETPEEHRSFVYKFALERDYSPGIIACYGETNLWEDLGRFTVDPETPEEKRLFDVCNNDFREKSAKYIKESNIDLNFIGMAKHESRKRKMILNIKGPTYKVANGERRCCPLANLTHEDVWAYIFSQSLPYLPVYDYPHKDRRYIRNECTLCYNGEILKQGELFHYRQMYPEYIRAIEQRWGALNF